MKNKKLLAVLVISALGTMSAAAAPGVSVNSTTYGNNTTASDSGTAFGSNDKASGNQSVAIGIGNESAGSDSIAIGDGAVAGNPKDPDDQVGEQDYANAIAIGAQSKAQAKFTTAVGGFSQATKQDASAFGQQAYAWGEESTATGTMSQA
ncbi:MAG: hypothetical protein LKG17_06585 [Megasphaera sp.]|nr:hypothetical protein [Megasphaera sp.]